MYVDREILPACNGLMPARNECDRHRSCRKPPILAAEFMVSLVQARKCIDKGSYIV